MPKTSEPQLSDAKRQKPLVPPMSKSVIAIKGKRTSKVPWEKVSEPPKKSTAQPSQRK